MSDGDERGTSERPSDRPYESRLELHIDSEPGPEPDLELDCRDLRCPMPVIELARHLGDVEIGQVVGVVAHDVAARVDVPAWCRMRGQEYVGEDAASDGAPRFLVRRLS